MNGEVWIGKDGDHFAVDRSAAGFELPTISGGSALSCDSSVTTIDSAAPLQTSAEATSARLELRSRDGTRTATVPTRNGYVYVAAQVSGKATSRSTTMTVELLDADGHGFASSRTPSR